MLRMPGRSHSGEIAPLSAGERHVADRLALHVRHLAADIGERNLWRYEQLRAASRYVQDAFREHGYQVDLQSFESDGFTVENVEAERRGAIHPEEIVVIGAHYDSVIGCPGANDNASGMAALIELAGIFAGRSPGRTVRFVGFVNEEPPFFQTGRMGSVHYARRAADRRERLVAMLSIETIGAYSDERGSQRFPLPLFRWFYPDTGNFIAFVGDIRSRQLVRRTVAAFRRRTAFASEGAAVPGWIPGVSWSDHWSFWQHGYQAIMVTDTALFRYPAYHTPDDTPDKIDCGRIARVVSGLVDVIDDLAER